MYLAGCAYLFDHAWTSIYQILAVKADTSQIDTRPLTRDSISRGNLLNDPAVRVRRSAG